MILGVLWATPLQAVPISAQAWKGEFLGKRQGAFYVRMKFNGFATSKTRYMTGDVKVTIFNLLTKQRYVFSYPLRALGNQMPYWKVRSGKYLLEKIELVDPAGAKRTWSPSQGKSLIVKRQILSNFGLWSVRPSGSAGLAVKMEMVPNIYKENNQKSESRIAAVINGSSGLVQEKFGGQAVLEGAEDDHAENDQLRAAYTFTRQIAMYYELNLFKHNDRARQVTDVLSVYDNSVRECYTERLDRNATLRGKVAFKFILSWATGTMRKLKHAGGSAKDPRLVKCMYLVLSQIQFPIEETMLGELTYSFDVK